MSGFGGVIKAVFVKDFVSEMRDRQVLAMMIILGLLTAWVFAVAVEASEAGGNVTAAAVLLVTILFSVVLACERSFGQEHENDCISALALAPVDAGDIYIAKMLVNVTLLCIFEVFAALAVTALFDVSIKGKIAEFVTALLLVNIGFSGVGTLLGAAVQGTRAQNSLLSIIATAVLLPMIVPAVFVLLYCFGAAEQEIAGTGALAMVGDVKKAMGFMAAFDGIFVTVCWLLFGQVMNMQGG